MKNLPQSAFTLVELLVAVAIIGILAAIGTFGYTTAVKLARDAKRQSDLKVIQSALEQYHSDQHFYPPSSFTVSSGMRLTNVTGQNPAPPETKVYLNNVSSDPSIGSSNPNYKYIPLPRSGTCDTTTPLNCQFYCLYANFEVGLSDNACTNQSGYNFEMIPP